MDNENAGAPAPDALNVGMEQEVAEDQQDEGQESEAAAKPEDKKVEEAKKLSKLKLKVYGEEMDEELPFSIEDNPEAVEYLTKQLQLAKAAQRAMQENGTFKSQVSQFLNGIKSNTKQALQDLGIDPREFAAQVIEEEIKKQQMTPEQRELEELRQEKKRIEDERKKEKEDYERKELERLESMEFERIENGISEALKTSHLPKTPKTVQRIAQYMHLGLQNGVSLEPSDVLPLVEKDYEDELRDIISQMGEDHVENFIGKDVINKLRKKNIAKSKTTPASVKSQIKDVAQKQEAPKKDEQKQSFKEFFKF